MFRVNMSSLRESQEIGVDDEMTIIPYDLAHCPAACKASKMYSPDEVRGEGKNMS